MFPREKQAHALVFGLGEFNILVISLVVVGVAKLDRVFAEIVGGFIFQCGQGTPPRFDRGRILGPYGCRKSVAIFSRESVRSVSLPQPGP